MSFDRLAADLTAGCAAGMSHDALLHPIDTLRARLDVSRTHTTANPMRAMVLEAHRVVAADGLVCTPSAPAAVPPPSAYICGTPFAQGYGLCLVGSAPANALYFSSYQVFKRLLSNQTEDPAASSPVRDALSGFGAEVFAAGLWTPLDVLKQRLQVAPTELGVTGAVRAACAEQGLIGLWRGYAAGLCVWGPFSALYFATYEALRDAFGRDRAGSNLFAGMGGGALAALSTQPLDCAKTRLQVGATAPGVGLFQAMRDVFAQEGLQALMRGAVARALWLAPGCGITITVFDFVTNHLQRQP